jgi:hypothetical protein
MGWRKVPQNSPTQQEFDALKARVVAVEDKCSSLRAEVDDLDARVDGLDARVAALEVVPTPEPEPTLPPTIPAALALLSASILIPPGDTIVSEITGLDTELANHADIAYYANFEGTLQDLVTVSSWGPGHVPMTFPNRTRVYADTLLYPTDAVGYPYGFNTSLVSDATLGIKVLREGSQYGPNNCFDYNQGSTWQSCALVGKGSQWVTKEIFFRDANVSGGGFGFPSGVRGFSSTPVNEAWMRFGVFFETSVRTGFNEIGCKLPEAANHTWWVLREIGSENAMHLKTYNHFSTGGVDTTAPAGDLENWGSGPNNDINVGQWGASNASGTTGNPMNKRIFFGQWHTIELHIKRSSVGGAFDGIREAWLDDELLWSHQNCMTHGAGADEIAGFRLLFYHGGSGIPNNEMFLRLAGVAVSTTRRIGPLKRP